jgi:hypothetical protein
MCEMKHTGPEKDLSSAFLNELRDIWGGGELGYITSLSVTRLHSVE